MDNAWTMRVTCMGYAQNMYGIRMECMWNVAGISVEYASNTCAYVWNIYGICDVMEHVSNMHGIYIYSCLDAYASLYMYIYIYKYIYIFP